MKNEYVVIGDDVVIYLDRRDGSQIPCYISKIDFDRVNEYPGKWHAHLNKGRKFYVWGNLRKSDGSQYTIHMHRWIMSPEPEMQVDHVDGDSLNNRRNNLRNVNQSQNQQNRSGKARKDSRTGVRGVTESFGKFRVHVMVDGKRRYFGGYETIEEASLVAQEVRAKYMPFSEDAMRRHSG